MSADLAGLFLILALISLLIGAVGIANTTLVAVLERTEEIGLRRAVGARPRHIAAQFLAESTTLGTLGGLIGTCIGVAVVVIFAAAKNWTAVLNPAYTLPAPLIGSVVGLLAGAYPALRAARTSPLAALRHAPERNDDAHPHRPLPALACCCAALAACTAAAPKGPNTTVTTPERRQAASTCLGPGGAVERGVHPLRRARHIQQRRAGARRVAIHPRRAVHERRRLSGHDHQRWHRPLRHLPRRTPGLAFTQPWGGWGYLGAADAQQYGFRVPPAPRSPPSASGDSSRPTRRACPRPNRPRPTSAARSSQDFSNASQDGALAGIATLGNDIANDVLHDPAVKNATRAWSACMAKNGYTFDQPQDVSSQELQAMYGGRALDQPRQPRSARPPSRRSSRRPSPTPTAPSPATWPGSTSPSRPATSSSSSTPTSRRSNAAVRQYRAAYAKELSKLPALLRTAKAQPFRPAKRSAGSRPSPAHS